jgi:hypothetical protein
MPSTTISVGNCQARENSEFRVLKTILIFFEMNSFGGYTSLQKFTRGLYPEETEALTNLSVR